MTPIYDPPIISGQSHSKSKLNANISDTLNSTTTTTSTSSSSSTITSSSTTSSKRSRVSQRARKRMQMPEEGHWTDSWRRLSEAEQLINMEKTRKLL